VTKQRVLFIGGTGVISSACRALAVESGIDLHILNRGRTTARPVPPGVTVVRGDINSGEIPALGDFDSVTTSCSAGRGSRFRMYLPLQVGQTARVAGADHRRWSASQT
jgi:hypothetical protein